MALSEDYEDMKPTLCPICGGVKPAKNSQERTGAQCTCSQCSDAREYD